MAVPSRISDSSSLRVAASAIGTLFIGLGINAILRPQYTLTIFELDAPASPLDQHLVDDLLAIIGFRDIAMGLAVNVAAYFGTRQALGWIMLISGGVGFGDGAICWANGRGVWNHWGFMPIAGGLGGLLLGALDRV